MEHPKRNSFTGSIGFVLAAAGSAVGLGNIWRFPYLAAKDGGGLFLVMYILLALTFGFTLLTTEVAIGRKTKQSPLTAYDKIKKGWKPLGVIACIVPITRDLVYCVIGGWVVKYFLVFLTGEGVQAAEDGYFTGYITSTWEPIVLLIVFLGITAFVVFKGVDKGIESTSRIIMPLLLLLILGISIFSLTLKNTDAERGYPYRSGRAEDLSDPEFGRTDGKRLLHRADGRHGTAVLQLERGDGDHDRLRFLRKDDANLAKSINQIEIFDTVVAFLAGVMIIPAVYTFMGADGLQASGPSLMLCRCRRFLRRWVRSAI